MNERQAYDDFCRDIYDGLALKPPWPDLRDGARWHFKQIIGIALEAYDAKRKIPPQCETPL
jgi:hypothetical protein